MSAENDVALLLLIWAAVLAMCGGLGALYWAIWTHYRRKRIERERNTTK